MLPCPYETNNGKMNFSLKKKNNTVMKRIKEKIKEAGRKLLWRKVR